MEPVSSTKSAKVSKPAALVGLAAAVATLVLLASLHVLSPEFDPSWRMVSEYALGSYGLVLSFFFLAWGISTWGLAYALRSYLTTRSGRIGLWLLIISGIGEAMASVFNIRYDVEHNLASLFGFMLPIAALLIGRSLGRQKEWSFARRRIRLFSHLPWISAVIYVASLVIMTLQALQYYHGQLPSQALTSLPNGILGITGWTDRLYVIVACLWNAVVAWYSRLT